MRTAEEMIMELDSALLFNDVKKLMKQYAKEALQEAAERAKRETNDYYTLEVEQSILLLIDELK